MKTRKRIAAILIAAIMVISGIPSMVFADDTSPFNYLGSKKASPTTLGQDRKTTVTLSLPSGEYKNKVDIVFLMDDSTSTKNSKLKFVEESNALFEHVIENNPGIELKVGVIKFKGRPFDAFELSSGQNYSGLVKYSDDTKAVISNAIGFKFPEGEAADAVYGRGSNVHAALQKAYDWLKADTEVPDGNKYFITLTDGRAYIWNDDNGNPKTFFTQNYQRQTGPGVYISNNGIPEAGQKTGTYNKAGYPLVVGDTPVFYFGGSGKAPYDALFASKHKHLTGDEYDSDCQYAIDGTGNSLDGTVNVIENVKDESGNDISFKYAPYKNYYEFQPADSAKDVKYFEANPYPLVKRDDGSVYYDTTKENPNYYQINPDSLQKGVYKAGHLWKEMKDKGYKTGSIVSYRGEDYLVAARSFCYWLADNSDYGADIKEAAEVKQLFDGIDNSIRYMVGSGVVTDQIKDDFDLDESSATPFRMTYDGSNLSATSAGDNKWNFDTADNDGKFPYVVDYDKSTKTITWTINVPIENLKKITLSYDLILKEDRAPGTYDTNEFAKLAYTSSDGKYEGEYPFEKPQVTYSKPAPTPANYTLTINYVYANGRMAATSYRSTLKAGASYGPINSPAINGYRADRASVSGVMPEGDVTYTVVYRRTGGGNPPNNPGGPVVTPGDGQTTPPTIPDEPTPTTEPPTTDIVDPEPPLAAGAWALINLICAILTALGAIIALFRRKEEEDEDEAQNAYKAEDEEEEEDDNRGKKMLAAKAAGVLAGVAAPITFFLTEDMSLPMQLTDKWTLLMVVILAVQIVAAVFNKKASELDDDEEEAAGEAAN